MERDLLRQTAAHQVLKIHRFEARQREGDTRISFIHDRKGPKYIDSLRGLIATFAYARSLPGSNVVLDIGTGTGRGCADLARQFPDFYFTGTGLCRYQQTENYLPGNRFRVTSGEVLRGIGDESIACIISVFSITYSHAQQLVAERIDQVLKPGGVIKASFLFSPETQPSLNLSEQTRLTLDATQPRDHEDFKKALLAMGYDLEIKPIFYDDGVRVRRYILAAIKPGNPTLLTAKDILNADAISLLPEERFKRWVKELLNKKIKLSHPELKSEVQVWQKRLHQE